MNQTVFWSFAILGLFIWLLFRPYATAPWKIFGAFALLLVAEPITIRTLEALSRAYPIKYDYILQAMDQAIGLTAFQVARVFTPEVNVLIVIYTFLNAAMLTWFGIHVQMQGGEPGKLLFAYFSAFLMGAFLYGIVPAMGPRYAFNAVFPLTNPTVVPATAVLHGYPNAMPSLHMTTAFILVLFNNRNRWLLSLSLLFLAGTVAATLALEHYVIDLVVAIPFACFFAEIAHRKVRRGLRYLCVVLMWLGSIRFFWPILLEHFWVLRLSAVVTVLLGVHAIARPWLAGRVPRLCLPPILHGVEPVASHSERN